MKLILNMEKLEKFWIFKSKILNWDVQPTIAIKKKTNNKNIWFPDGKLNVAKNCLHHALSNSTSNKIALITISKNKEIEKYTYKKLFNIVRNFTSYLSKSSREKKIKNILIHSSASIESAVTMLASANVGIHFSVVFEDLPEKALDIRIKLIKPDLIITRSAEKCNFFLKSLNKNGLKKSIVLNTKKKFKNKRIKFYDFKNLNLKNNLNVFKSFNSNRLLFTLFTSGSTGEPKGIQHSSGGYLLYSKFSSIVKFGMNKNSIVLTASDAGWINGHTYALFSPLSLGATTLLVETPITLLDYNFLIKILRIYKVTILYMPVTLIRLLKGLIPKNKKFYNHSLKAIGSMGEPLAKSVSTWYSKFFFKNLRPVVNTYFQTETGGIISSPSYNQKAEATFGTVGNNLTKFIKFLKPTKKKFDLSIKTPWPGCMVNVINGNKFWKQYWNKNNFKLFDIGSFVNSNLVIHGRSDDVINIRGHRLGSGEVESKLLEIKEILEVCAVSSENYLEGSVLVLFITLKKKRTNKVLLKDLISNKIYNYFGSYALPKDTIFVDELPKTRSGKILRRVLRNLYQNPKINSFGDLSTMININSIKKIKNILNNV